MEKNIKKNVYTRIYIYLRITESFCCTAEMGTNTSILKNLKKEIAKTVFQRGSNFTLPVYELHHLVNSLHCQTF